MSDFSRHEKLIGEKGIKALADANIIIFGIGGVGGYAAEALARAAVGSITLVDCDDVEKSNANRQIIALESTIGMPKTQVMENRIKDINPDCRVTPKKVFVDEKNIGELLEGIDYAIDAVDNVSAKLAIAGECKERGIKVISAMGAGNKLKGDFRVMDIYETKGDALARVMRRELRRKGIDSLNVVCTDEKGLCEIPSGEPIPSISYMPGLCGLTIAGEVIREIIKGH